MRGGPHWGGLIEIRKRDAHGGGGSSASFRFVRLSSKEKGGSQEPFIHSFIHSFIDSFNQGCFFGVVVVGMEDGLAGSSRKFVVDLGRWWPSVQQL